MGDGDERIPDPASPLHGGRPLDEVVPEVDESPEAEPPSLELWSEVGDVWPWGTLLLLLAWAAMFALSGAVRAFSQPDGLWALGASATGMPAGESAESVRLHWPPAGMQPVPRLILDDVVHPDNARHHDPTRLAAAVMRAIDAESATRRRAVSRTA